MNFEDFVQRFDAGEVDESVIDELLAIAYPSDPDAAAAHKKRVMPDGQAVKFQAVGLNRKAKEAFRQDRVEAMQQPEPEPVDDRFAGDVPDEVYDEDRPNYVPEIKSRVGIVQAVRTWGKPQASIKDNKTEGVKVRCPYSHHTDNDPSAWVNTQKNTWYCLDASTRVLTANLRWVSIGDLSVGDDLIGFDEEPEQGRRGRCWRNSSIEARKVLKRQTYEIELSNGDKLTASADHLWLCDTSNGRKWVRTDNLINRNGNGVTILKPLNTWEEDKTWDAGYLAAAFDGEGSLINKVEGSTSARAIFYQRDNEMWSQFRQSVEALGFSATEYLRNDNCWAWELTGRAEIMRLLGVIRPERLINKFDVSTWGEMHAIERPTVVGLSDLGENEVVAIQTSTKTFVAEGYASHNCGKCQVGGDVIDFYAARKHDLEPTQFHSDKQFGQIVEEMAEELGITIVSTPDGSPVVEADTDSWASNQLDRPERPEERPQVVDSATELTDEGELTIETLVAEPTPPSAEADEPVTISDDEMLRGVAFDQRADDDELDEMDAEDAYLAFDWHELELNPDTFLYQYIRQAEIDLPWVPPEYSMMLGLQAIGIACDHTTTTVSYGHTTTAATLMVVIGNSATGKSTALNRLTRLLNTATGPRYDPATHDGVKKISGISSSEALLARIRSEVVDINDPEPKPVEVPTNAFLTEDEFASFASKASRTGSSHIKQRIMQLHDFTKTDPNRMEIAAEDFSLTSSYRAVRDTYFNATFLTQPKSLESITDQVDMSSGFFNRMWFCYPRPDIPRRSFSGDSIEPSPDYIPKYERMWKDCNLKQRVIPFDDDAAALMDSHPLVDRFEQLAAENPMFARWQMSIVRVAFMLAVNENLPLVGVKQVQAAFLLVSKYLIPCAAQMIEHSLQAAPDAQTTLRDDIVKWAERYYDRHSEWPEARLLRAQRWWKSLNVKDQNQGKFLTHETNAAIEIKLIDGPWGANANRTVMVVPTGDFAVYHGKHGSKFKYEDFYAGRKVR